MRDYSKVSPQFWIGSTGKKLRAKGIECQLVSLYLMTCSHANMLGMYYLPKIYIAHECGLSIEGATKGLQSAIEAGFCSYDDASEVVWVHEMATYQIGEQLTEKDLRVKGVQNEYNAQPESPYLKPFFAKYSSQFLMTLERGNEAPCKPLVSQEQEQEQEQYQEQETKTPSRINALDDGFHEFWNHYPKKVGKDAAQKAWTKKKPKVDEVIKALSWQVESTGWTKSNGDFIPNPATYLNEGRWKDEPVSEGVPF
jgi:hypothetical protein